MSRPCPTRPSSSSPRRSRASPRARRPAPPRRPRGRARSSAAWPVKGVPAFVTDSETSAAVCGGYSPRSAAICASRVPAAATNSTRLAWLFARLSSTAATAAFAVTRAVPGCDGVQCAEIRMLAPAPIDPTRATWTKASAPDWLASCRPTSTSLASALPGFSTRTEITAPCPATGTSGVTPIASGVTSRSTTRGSTTVISTGSEVTLTSCVTGSIARAVTAFAPCCRRTPSTTNVPRPSRW